VVVRRGGGGGENERKGDGREGLLENTNVLLLSELQNADRTGQDIT
jgi:hypothetical protein